MKLSVTKIEDGSARESGWRRSGLVGMYRCRDWHLFFAGETNNVAAANPGVVKRLAAALDKVRKDRPARD